MKSTVKWIYNELCDIPDEYILVHVHNIDSEPPVSASVANDKPNEVECVDELNIN